MPPSRTTSLLVVDDDASVRAFLTMALQSEGYSVRTANDGRQALQRLTVWQPDAVLADVQMPVMTGIEFLLTLRAQGDRTPVAFMSAGSNAQTAAVAYGAEGYLGKPFQLDELLDLVAHLASDGHPIRQGIKGDEEERQAKVSQEANRVKVVVINSNDNILRLLGEIVRAAGFDAISVHADEVGRSVPAMQEFLRRHSARVVVYDVSPPYPENWALLNELRYAEMMSGSWRQYVITTPNKQALDEHVGRTGAIELVGDQVDREAIARAVQRGVLV